MDAGLELVLLYLRVCSAVRARKAKTIDTNFNSYGYGD
jgi:hypothetical protein